MIEMCDIMDDLRRQNQNLEDNIHHSKQCQHSVGPTKDTEMLDHEPLSDEIWGRRC